MSTEPHTTFENKKIVYSDTILPLKDIGNNLRITTIENVSKTYLEYCLEIIFISNPDVVLILFNIQLKMKESIFIQIKKYLQKFGRDYNFLNQ